MITIRMFIALLTFWLLSSTLVGCQTHNHTSINELEDNIPRIEQEIHPLAKEIVGIDDVPKRLQLWIKAQEFPEEELVKAFKIEDNTFIVILLSEKEALDYIVEVTKVSEQITIQEDEDWGPLTSVTYEVKEISSENSTEERKDYLAIIKIEESTSEIIQLDRLLTSKELDQSSQSESSQSNNQQTVQMTAMGGGIAHLIPVETLTEDGIIKQ